MSDIRDARAVEIPPLVGDVVYAWPMFPNAGAGGKLFLADSWKLGDDVLTPTRTPHGQSRDGARRRTATHRRRCARGSRGCRLPYLKSNPFTHHVTFSGENWRAPTTGP